MCDRDSCKAWIVRLRRVEAEQEVKQKKFLCTQLALSLDSQLKGGKRWYFHFHNILTTLFTTSTDKPETPERGVEESGLHSRERKRLTCFWWCCYVINREIWDLFSNKISNDYHSRWFDNESLTTKFFMSSCAQTMDFVVERIMCDLIRFLFPHTAYTAVGACMYERCECLEAVNKFSTSRRHCTLSHADLTLNYCEC